MKKDYTVLLIQLDGNLASTFRLDALVVLREDDQSILKLDDQSIWSKRRKLSSHQVESREPCNLSSRLKLFGMMQKI